MTSQDIWKGYHKIHNDVCIKALRVFGVQLQHREESFKDFAHEALVWKQLYHQNILPYLFSFILPHFTLDGPRNRYW